MAEQLTLKQLSSIFLFKFFKAYIYLILSFDVEINACVTSSANAIAFLSLFGPKSSSQLSKAIATDENVKSEKRTTIGTVGSIINGLDINSNQVAVDSTNIGNKVGYALAGIFFTATVVQTLSNWDSTPVNVFLSGLADSIVPNFFETEVVDEGNRRSDDYSGNLIARQCKKYCLNSKRRKHSSSVGINDRIKKR